MANEDRFENSGNENMEVDVTATKDMSYRVDLKLDDERVTTYITVTGIPEDLPEEYEHTVVRAAEAQFAKTIGSRPFLEFYAYAQNEEKHEDKPTFYNLSKIGKVKILQVTKVDEN